jgi:hypothetical protein
MSFAHNDNLWVFYRLTVQINLSIVVIAHRLLVMHVKSATTLERQIFL